MKKTIHRGVIFVVLFISLCFAGSNSFAEGGHTEGGGSDLAVQFVSQAYRAIDRIRNAQQDVVDINDLLAVLKSGISIIPVPYLIDPDTKKNIGDKTLDAYATLYSIQLVDYKWEVYLNKANAGCYDALIVHELLRATGKYDDEGYRISVGVLRLDKRAEPSLQNSGESERNIQLDEKIKTYEKELQDFEQENSLIKKEEESALGKEQQKYEARLENSKERSFFGWGKPTGDSDPHEAFWARFAYENKKHSIESDQEYRDWKMQEMKYKIERAEAQRRETPRVREIIDNSPVTEVYDRIGELGRGRSGADLMGLIDAVADETAQRALDGYARYKESNRKREQREENLIAQYEVEFERERAAKEKEDQMRVERKKILNQQFQEAMIQGEKSRIRNCYCDLEDVGFFWSSAVAKQGLVLSFNLEGRISSLVTIEDNNLLSQVAQEQSCTILEGEGRGRWKSKEIVTFDKIKNCTYVQ